MSVPRDYDIGTLAFGFGYFFWFFFLCRAGKDGRDGAAGCLLERSACEGGRDRFRLKVQGFSCSSERASHSEISVKIVYHFVIHHPRFTHQKKPLDGKKNSSKTPPFLKMRFSRRHKNQIFLPPLPVSHQKQASKLQRGRQFFPFHLAQQGCIGRRRRKAHPRGGL